MNNQNCPNKQDAKLVSKSRKPSFKAKRNNHFSDAVKEKEIKFPKKNDPAFYTKYKELAENTARIAFSHRNGSDIQYSVNGNPVNRNVDPIITMQYVPIPGRSTGLTSGINMSANAAYKVLNRKYRGSPSSRYQMADLGIAQFGIMDFYLSLAQAERVYGLCQVARVNQRQVPRELVFALGFDYEDIANRLADFRAKLNALIVRAQVLCLVKGYPFLDHHMFLVSNIFKDKDTQRANYLAYTKPGYWLWDPTSFTTGSSLKWVTNRVTRTMYNTSIPPYSYCGLQTMDDVIYNLDTQLNALINDSDIDAICADILALFDNDNTGDNLIKLQFLPDGYQVDPIFSEEALKQWHNSIMPVNLAVGSTLATNSQYMDVNKRFATPYPTSIIPTGDSISNHTGLIIYQVDGRIQFDVHCGAGNLAQIIDGTSTAYGVASATDYSVAAPILDTDILTPSTDDVLEMTRQTSLWYKRSVTDSGSTYYVHYLVTIGTVLLTSGYVWTFSHVGSYSIDSNGDYNFGNYLNVIPFSSFITPTNMGGLVKFDWYPIVYYGSTLFADLDNYRSIEFPVLGPIHEVATLSEFHNPISDILIKDL